MTSKNSKYFRNMVDELVEFGKFDPELAEAITWLDEKAQKKGVSFYDMVFEVLYKYDISNKAKEWMKQRK